MAKIMLPSGTIIERKPLHGKGIIKMNFKGHQVIVNRVNNVLFDFIAPGFGYDFDFWKVKEGINIAQIIDNNE